MGSYTYTEFIQRNIYRVHRKKLSIPEDFFEDDVVCVRALRRSAAHGLGPLALCAVLLDDRDTHTTTIGASEATRREVARPRQRCATYN